MIWIPFLVCSIASAENGKSCFQDVTGAQMSDVAAEWLKGERSATDRELQTLKQIRTHSKKPWSLSEFQSVVFWKIERILAETEHSLFLDSSSYFDKPVRMAGLLYRLSLYSDVLTNNQKQQLDAYSRDRTPFRVEDWGKFDHVDDFLLGVAATLVEGANFSSAMTGAFIHKKFIPPAAREVFLKTGSLAGWNPPSDSNPLLILGPRGSFHPILLTHEGLRQRIEIQLSVRGNPFGRDLAHMITRYVYENLEATNRNPEVMRVFLLVLSKFPDVRLHIPGFQFDTWLTAEQVGQRLIIPIAR